MSQQTYILVDLANLFFRARHGVRGGLEDKIGLSLHTVLTSMRKAWRTFGATHTVICLEGRSWRKDYYEPYKRQRAEARAAMNTREQEEERVFWETFDQFKDFIINKTNTTVLHHSQLEADDLIAGWVTNHPDDNHIIISTDGDFVQLVANNVKQYNGVTDILITQQGVFNVANNKTKKMAFTIGGNAKIKVGKEDPSFIPPADWIDYLLFLKCMRGDTSDNIFSAYPGAREKGTKNKVGLQEAFQDRKNKGYNWNNLMLQKWMDHEGVEHRVLDDYNRNQVLCDLKAQPDDIKKIIKEVITSEEHKTKQVSQVGVRLLKFCKEYDLQRISDDVQSYAEPLNARYAV